MDANSTRSRPIIDGAALVPLSSLIILFTILVGGAVWVTRIEARLQGIENNLALFIDGQRVEEWVAVFKAQNPALSVPALRESHQ